MQLPFFGPAYLSESPKLSADDLINMYPEVAEGGSGAAVGRLRGTPGYKLFTNIGTGAMRGLWSGEGRLFAAAGSDLYEITSVSGAVTPVFIGNIDNGVSDDVNTPVLFFPNGRQLMVVSNGHVYVWDGVTFGEPTYTTGLYTDLVIDAVDATKITSAMSAFGQADFGMRLVVTGGTGFTPGTYTILSVDAAGVATLSGPAGAVGATGGEATEKSGTVTARTATVLDTYGIIAPAPHGNPGDADFETGNNIYISTPNDFTAWDAADSKAKMGYPDHILALMADHQELYVLGDLESSEVWRDTGNADFPFERDMSAFLHYGLAAQFSVARLGFSGLAWLAWSAGMGDVQAIYVQGFSPQRISTHAIEAVWRQYQTVTDAEAYSYVEDGHNFYVLTFPTADATWVYDLTASQQLGKACWHRRGEWDGTTLHRDRFSCHAYGYVNGLTGITWANQPVHFCGDYQNGNIYVRYLDTGDADGDPVYRQRTFAHMQNEAKRIFWSRFELLAETTDPLTATLDMSRDYGHTFVNPRDRTATAANQRLLWWRLGASRDAVFRVTINGTSKVALINTFADGAPGDS
jgi:hypothetical protein